MIRRPSRGETLLDVLSIAEMLIEQPWAWCKSNRACHARDRHEQPCDPLDRRAERFTILGALAAAAPDDRTYLRAVAAVWVHAHGGMLLDDWQDMAGHKRTLEALRRAIVDERVALLPTVPVVAAPPPPAATPSETDLPCALPSTKRGFSLRSNTPRPAPRR